MRQGLLGDVAISIPVAARQARELGCSLEERVTVLMVHGLLHLAGFDHERGPAARRRMAAIERRVQEGLGVHVPMV